MEKNFKLRIRNESPLNQFIRKCAQKFQDCSLTRSYRHKTSRDTENIERANSYVREVHRFPTSRWSGILNERKTTFKRFPHKNLLLNPLKIPVYCIL